MNSKTTFVTVNLYDTTAGKYDYEGNSKTTFVTVNLISSSRANNFNCIQKQLLLLLILVFKGFIFYNIAQKP